jgi:hypothetical protein
MIERRDVMGGGLAAGVAAMFSPAPAAAAAQREGQDAERVAAAVNDLRQTVQAGFDSFRIGPWRAVGLIREQQRSWLRSTQKYPDFIEVGLNAWEGLHDWHVRYQQPINMARMPDGRYAMVFMFTTVILRPELQPDYISLPYDTDTRR